MRERGLAPVIGKMLELLIGLALIASVTAVMLGAIVPAHSETLGEQTAAAALDSLAETVETAGWAASSTVGNRHITVELPMTIAGRRYRIDAAAGTLRVHHPSAALSVRRHLALPRGCEVQGEAPGGTVEIGVTRTTTTCRIVLEGADAG